MLPQYLEKLERRIQNLEKRMDNLTGANIAKAWAMSHEEVMEEIRNEVNPKEAKRENYGLE